MSGPGLQVAGCDEKHLCVFSSLWVHCPSLLLLLPAGPRLLLVPTLLVCLVTRHSLLCSTAASLFSVPSQAPDLICISGLIPGAL